MSLVTSRFQANRSVDSRSILCDVLGYAPAQDGARAVEIERNATGFKVEIPVPGFAADDVRISLDQNVLTIAAEKKYRLQRTLVLPDEIDPESITANVENGMLTMSMAAYAKPQPRVIHVGNGAAQSNSQNDVESKNIESPTEC